MSTTTAITTLFTPDAIRKSSLLSHMNTLYDGRNHSRSLTPKELKAIGFKVSKHKQNLIECQDRHEIIYKFRLWGDIAAFLHIQGEKRIPIKACTDKFSVELAGDQWTDDAIQKTLTKIIHSRFY
jgi:hypothetical protein